MARLARAVRSAAGGPNGTSDPDGTGGSETRADGDAECLACLALAIYLDALDRPEPAGRVRRSLLEGAGRRALGVEPDADLVRNLVQALEGGDPAALSRDAARALVGVDPALAAHELLLRAGGRGERARRGVFTTPEALADWLVARVDRLLCEELGLELGLADRTSWAELSERRGLEPPAGVPPDEPFVRVLDPAAGGGVFPLAVARRVRRTRLERGRCEGLSDDGACRRWETEDAPELASRIELVELLPAQRALARWSLARVFGGRTPRIDAESPLSESAALRRHATVVVGNPPWSVRSGNLDPDARALVEPYRYAGGERVVEKGALRLEMHLQDDCVKFVRLAELLVERAGAGAVALVTNHTWLDSPSLRGMRASLCATFSRLEVLDLHGSRTRRTAERRRANDENPFGIGQGVAALVAARGGGGARARVRHGELVGTRAEKLDALAEEHARAIPARELEPAAPRWFLVPRDTAHEAEYERWVGLRELFLTSVSGIVTAHDRLVVDFDDAPLLERARLLADPALPLEELRARLRVRDNSGWSLERARGRFREDPERERCLVDFAYRPFDTRRLLYHPALVWCDRRRVMGALDGERNFALAVCRQLAAPPWRHVFATRQPMDDGFVSNRSRERTHFFPLLCRRDPRDPGSPLVSNLEPAAVRALLPRGVEAEPLDVVRYVYGVLHAKEYRARHRDSLAIDFPRIPPAPDAATFRAFVDAGRALFAAHLSDPGRAPAPLELRGEPLVHRGYPRCADGRVELGPSAWLGPVREAVWAHEIGAYAPCRKWLKDRVGRRLSAAELETFARVVAALEASLAALERVPELPAPGPRAAERS